MKTMFEKNNATKRGKSNMNKHKVVIITGQIYQNNKKLFVTFNSRNECRMDFADRLWLPFIDQSQSDVVVFVIIYFCIYKIF